MSSTNNPLDPKPSAATGYPAAGAAYPYPAPPPQPAPYYANPNPNPYPNGYNGGYYQNPNPNPSYQRNLFFRRLLYVAIASIIVVGAITFIVWLVLRPKLPNFTVSAFDVSDFNLSSPDSVSARFDVKFTVVNPNSKIRISYDQIAAAVLYGRGDLIAQASMYPFYQTTGDQSVITVRLAADRAYVGTDVVNGMRSDRTNRDGVVRFGIRVSSIVRFKAGAWRVRRYALKVACDEIGVRFKDKAAGVGSMVGSPRACQVWI